MRWYVHEAIMTGLLSNQRCTFRVLKFAHSENNTSDCLFPSGATTSQNLDGGRAACPSPVHYTTPYCHIHKYWLPQFDNWWKIPSKSAQYKLSHFRHLPISRVFHTCIWDNKRVSFPKSSINTRESRMVWNATFWHLFTVKSSSLVSISLC